MGRSACSLYSNPLEWPLVVAIVLDELVDLSLEVDYGINTISSNGKFGHLPYPVFDQIAPGTVSWCAMDLIARMLSQPLSHSGAAIHGMIVVDQVNLQIG